MTRETGSAQPMTRDSASGGTASLDLPLFEERLSLRQQVGDALRAALVAGEMRPGVLYSAPALAEKFGVSATPVREAMLADTEEPGGTGFAAFQVENRATGQITPRIPGFRVAGKTGTAQVKKEGGVSVSATADTTLE